MVKILLVDDDPDILKIAAKTLSSANYQTQTAPDALCALDALNSSHFDILVTDTNMPHHSGYELIRTVRNDPRFDQMAVAMFTGRRNKQDIEKALKLGADDYIVKPFDHILFLKKIGFLLQQRVPEKHSEIHFKNTPINAQAKVQLDARLETLSEVNVILTTAYKLDKGQVLNLNTTLFDELGIQPPAFKVLSSIKKGNDWHTTLVFVGTNDSILQKIRAHIYKKSGRRVAQEEL